MPLKFFSKVCPYRRNHEKWGFLKRHIFWQFSHGKVPTCGDFQTKIFLLLAILSILLFFIDTTGGKFKCNTFSFDLFYQIHYWKFFFFTFTKWFCYLPDCFKNTIQRTYRKSKVIKWSVVKLFWNTWRLKWRSGFEEICSILLVHFKMSVRLSVIFLGKFKSPAIICFLVSY